MKKLTIVDIAKMAGVGTTTVSRYFNNGKIKEETRLKIEKIVKKNYRNNCTNFTFLYNRYDIRIY